MQGTEQMLTADIHNKENTKMMNMHDFHKRITSPSNRKDPYLDALATIRLASKKELGALASNLDWQIWGAAPEPEKA